MRTHYEFYSFIPNSQWFIFSPVCPQLFCVSNLLLEMCAKEPRKGLKRSTGSVTNPHAAGQPLMMWIRNLWTVYFIIWMILAPYKLCISTKLGLEDFPSIYLTSDHHHHWWSFWSLPTWVILWSQDLIVWDVYFPDAGLTLQNDAGEVVIDLKPCCYMGYSTWVTRYAALGKSPYIYLHFFFS